MPFSRVANESTLTLTVTTRRMVKRISQSFSRSINPEITYFSLSLPVLGHLLSSMLR
jgi:hypothetical protein